MKGKFEVYVEVLYQFYVENVHKTLKVPLFAFSYLLLSLATIYLLGHSNEI